MRDWTAIERRRKRRSAVLLTAAISCAGSCRNIKLRNLSEHGGCIEGERLLEGTTLVLRRNGEAMSGRVAWVHEDRCGVEFSEAVKIETALREIARPKHRAASHSRRPGLRCKPLTQAEKAALERWSVLGEQALGD